MRQFDRPNFWPLFTIALLACSMVIAGCQNRPEPSTETDSEAEADDTESRFAAPSVPAKPADGFVGSAACRECHAEISDHFHQHPMGQSLADVMHASPLEDYEENVKFDTPRAPRSTVTLSYEIEKTPDGVYHHEILTNEDGEVVYDLPVPVAFAVGSGKRGRSYLIDRGGFLFMSPVTWYSGGERWDLSPGYEGRNLHFDRRIVDGCLSCHAGRVAEIETAPDQYKPEPFLEESIGCERCHGPGEEHVAFHEGKLQSESDPMLDLSTLSPRARDHICFQCHLIGESRVTLYGRSEFDFRPGNTVDEIWAIILKGTGVESDQSTAAVNQAEQMLSSVCYQKSDGQMSCTSCHDPHRIPKPAERIEFYRSKCIACHGPDDVECTEPVADRLKVTEEDSCIVCHMPSLAANDVPHTSQTDHRILRRPQKTTPSKKTDNVYYVFGQEDGVLTEADLERASAISIIRSAEQTGNDVLAGDGIEILEEWLKAAPDDLKAQLSLGVAYWLLEDNRMAARTWEKALESNPDNEYLLRRLFVLYHDSGQLDLALKYGRQLVEINPYDYEYFGRLSHILAQNGEMSESAEAAERALELNPSASQLHQWLAQVYGSTGETELRDKHIDLYRKKTGQ
ncbi:tetratricopeptide repeat protein [Thalassoglobus sp. JC818]|uniref:tetratricopeptide repeat protein n=1 Tax=Thalassoglobus sp. JC818 TaxID=3232136 RepID=UPI0034594C6E